MRPSWRRLASGPIRMSTPPLRYRPHWSLSSACTKTIFFLRQEETVVRTQVRWPLSCLRAFDLPGIGRSERASKSGAGAGASEAVPAVRAGRDEERQAENRDG